MKNEYSIHLNGRPDKKGFDNGYFFVTINGERKKVFLPKGLKIDAAKFISDDEGQRVKNDKEFTKLLDQEKERLRYIIFDLKLNGKLTFENLKTAYSDVKIVVPEKPKFIEVNENYISFFDAFDKFQEINKNRYAAPYLRSYKATKEQIEKFDKSANWSKITEDWLTRFHVHLIKEKYAVNTIYGFFKTIRGVMRLAESRNIQVPKAYQYFKVEQEEKNNAFLNKTELQSLEKVEARTPDEELVKDLFLFRCYTGIRFQDMVMVNIEKLKDGTLPFYIQKSSKNHNIPVPEKAQKILKKYGSLDIPTYYEQKENKIIKVLCMRAKINSPFEQVKKIGNTVEVKAVPKYTLISSHSARRTWARMAYDAGWKILIISRIIGHTDVSTTMRYLNIGKDDFENLPNIF